MVNQVAFIGLGLIGGSLAKKIRKIFPQIKISALAHSSVTVEYALKQNIIDAGGGLEQVVGSADVIFVSVPIDNIVEYVKEIYGLSKPDAIIVDIGSTKRAICRKLAKYSSKFIGGHPMAGTEKTGIQNSDPQILANALFVLTPYKNTPAQKLKNIASFIQSIGMRTAVVSSEKHDAAVAAISHAPYFTAAALVRLADDLSKKTLAATGFKSSTRVAESDPLWGLDIARTNKTEILKALNNLKKEIGAVASLIKDPDQRKLLQYLQKSKKLRKEIYQ